MNFMYDSIQQIVAKSRVAPKGPDFNSMAQKIRFPCEVKQGGFETIIFFKFQFSLWKKLPFFYLSF